VPGQQPAVGRRVLAVEGDVADRAEVGAMAEQTVGEFGRINRLANNAGIFF
jgi:NAD(P)-dependent dehydrogenase (short-subunit alcohol dehydrogenase family)